MLISDSGKEVRSTNIHLEFPDSFEEFISELKKHWSNLKSGQMLKVGFFTDSNFDKYLSAQIENQNCSAVDVQTTTSINKN